MDTIEEQELLTLLGYEKTYKDISNKLKRRYSQKKGLSERSKCQTTLQGSWSFYTGITGDCRQYSIFFNRKGKVFDFIRKS